MIFKKVDFKSKKINSPKFFRKNYFLKFSKKVKQIRVIRSVIG